MLFAAFQDFNHPRHFHETWVVGTVGEGRSECWMEGRRHEVGPGSVVVIPPGVVHTGEGAHTPQLYWAFYPRDEVMRKLFGGQVPGRRCRVLDAPYLAFCLRNAHDAVWRAEDPALAELRLGSALAGIASSPDENERGGPDTSGGLPTGVKQAIEAIHDSGGKPGGLEELAYIAGYSLFHFIGLFRSAMGITPHQYVLSLRIARARRLLLEGVPAGQTALEVGFADQSHLTRHFRRFVGTTPGEFARRAGLSRSFVQD